MGITEAYRKDPPKNIFAGYKTKDVSVPGPPLFLMKEIQII
jgi:hypothetical protein